MEYEEHSGVDHEPDEGTDLRRLDVESDVRSPPDGLRSRNPLGWLRFFGPVAVIVSVTVGSGELIFPSRGGALFGYQLLWISRSVRS